MLPIYQREAMWLSFDAAIRWWSGAVSGLPDRASGRAIRRIVVLPEQPWLDGD